MLTKKINVLHPEFKKVSDNVKCQYFQGENCMLRLRQGDLEFLRLGECELEDDIHRYDGLVGTSR